MVMTHTILTMNKNSIKELSFFIISWWSQRKHYKSNRFEVKQYIKKMGKQTTLLKLNYQAGIKQNHAK